MRDVHMIQQSTELEVVLVRSGIIYCSPSPDVKLMAKLDGWLICKRSMLKSPITIILLNLFDYRSLRVDYDSTALVSLPGGP